MSPLTIVLETRTLPGFPEAADPAPLTMFALTVLIPVLFMVLVIGLGMGRRWLAADASAPAIAVPEGLAAEVLPSAESIESRRALVHAAAVRDEARGDIQLRAGKSDPDPFHP